MIPQIAFLAKTVWGYVFGKALRKETAAQLPDSRPMFYRCLATSSSHDGIPKGCALWPPEASSPDQLCSGLESYLLRAFFMPGIPPRCVRLEVMHVPGGCGGRLVPQYGLAGGQVHPGLVQDPCRQLPDGRREKERTSATPHRYRNQGWNFPRGFPGGRGWPRRTTGLGERGTRAVAGRLIPAGNPRPFRS